MPICSFLLVIKERAYFGVAEPYYELGDRPNSHFYSATSFFFIFFNEVKQADW
ncbi:MAG: hypothetical protein PUP92_08960 [Rhizonema sp. PD38]|nr:hypothetical protein [Rhizonema sp. PD38]